MIRISSTDLQKMMEMLLTAAGLPPADCAIVVESLLQADLRGVNTHGVLRLPLYLKRIKAGAVNLRPKPHILRETLATAQLDGDNGLGQISGHQAMLLAMDKAEACGLGAVAVQRGNHFGAGAYYGLLAVERDMIGIAATNTPPLMAPWGGKTALVGNNPFAVCIPAGNRPPVVLDLAFSQVAQGKISLAAAKGERIPLDWATDREGNPTADPAVALGGLLLPAGGYKGYGQAVMVDLLTGVLSGAGFGSHVMSMGGHPAEPQNSGQLYVALNIAAFREVAEFKQDVDRLIQALKNAPVAIEAQEIFLPGEQSWRRYEENLREGILVPESVLAELDAAATDLGLEWERCQDKYKL